MMTVRSVVLAAHGSTASPRANRPVHQLADAIAATGQFERVTPAFLQGAPRMTEVLQKLPPGEVVVVPVMTSEGYYLQKLPGLFAQNPGHHQYQIEFRPVVGVHPAVVNAVSRRLQGYLSQFEFDKERLTVVVVGHGTKRNAASGRSTNALVGALQTRHPDLRLVTSFLDQSPTVDDVVGTLPPGPVIVLPFLISLGPHVTVDVPRAFGFSPCENLRFPLIRDAADSGKHDFCLCDSPLGLYPEMPSIIVEIVNGASL